MICKVVTSETCHPTEIAKVEELLKTSFTLYNPHNVDANVIPVVVTAPPPPSPPSKSKEKSKTQEDNKSEASDWEGGREEDKSSAVSSSRISRARSKGKARKHSSSGSSSSSRSSSRSSRSSSRSRSRGKKRKHTNSPDADGKETFSIFTSEMLAKMKCEENSAYKEHDAAYEVYLDVPEMHPSYEDKYERFLQSYKKKYNTTEESEHMTKMWHKYWKLCIESIKGKDWKRKKRELLEKYRLQARAAKSEKTLSHYPHEGQSSLLASSGMIPPMSSAEVVMAITEISSRPLKDFSVSGTLDLMEVLSDKIGDVGSSLKMIVNGVRFFGLKTKKGMDLIAQEDNILTMNIVFERLLNMGRTVAPEERNFFEKVIAWGIHLIKHAKNFQEPETLDNLKSSSQSTSKAPKQSVRFDLNLFAQQTYNQDPNWIYKTLEESLEYVYGAKPDSEIVKQMYANIGAIHLNMSASTPFLMGGSTVSNISNNPGIVSHGDQTPSVSSFANIPHTPMTPQQSFSNSYQTPVMSYSSSAQSKLTDTTASINISQPPLPKSSPQLASQLDKNSKNSRLEFSSQTFSNPPPPDSAPPSLSDQPSFSNPPPPPPESEPPPPPPPPEESTGFLNQFMSYSSLHGQLSPVVSASSTPQDPQSSNVIDAILNMAKQGTFRK